MMGFWSVRKLAAQAKAEGRGALEKVAIQDCST